MSHSQRKARQGSQQLGASSASQSSSSVNTTSSQSGLSRLNGLFHHIHPSPPGLVGDSYLVHSSFVPMGLTAPPSQYQTPSKSGRSAIVNNSSLGTWTLRIGQQHHRAHGAEEDEEEEQDETAISDSDTETDSDDDGQKIHRAKDGKGDRRAERTPDRGRGPPADDTFWYESVIGPDDLMGEAVGGNHGEAEWSTLELRIRVAWDMASLDVLANERKRLEDGSYPSLRLAIDRDGASSQDAEKAEREDKRGTSIELTLYRLTGMDELRAATSVCAEIMKVASFLKGKTQHLVEERDAHRRLLRNNRKNERYKEANSSLVNPGRIKRKLEDDEGFEGD